MAVGVERTSVTLGRTDFFAAGFFFGAGLEAALTAGFFAGAGLEAGAADVFFPAASLGFAAGFGFSAVFLDILSATGFAADIFATVFFVVSFFAMFPASGFAVGRTRRSRRRMEALYSNGRGEVNPAARNK
jgi:hypothetical protein